MSRLFEIVEIAKSACLAGMQVVNRFQIQGVPDAEVKVSDKTLLTIADKASQEAVRKCFETLPDVSFWGEEQDKKGFIGAGRFGIINDPLDGTNAFVIGLLTSTVILGIYDRDKSELVGCVIGEPASGRMWSCCQDQPTVDQDSCVKKVWADGQLKDGTIFIDVCHGFKSHGRQVLTDAGSRALFGSLNMEAKIFLPGSNGLMQALIANGRERMAGSITTAIGFPGDICGGLLVLGAGGAVVAFEITDQGPKRTDFLDVIKVDALICANSIETAEVLARAFEQAAIVK